MAAHPNSLSDPPAAQVMLLGTFHFQDAGLDRYKPQSDVDIFSDRRQREVEEVVAHLARYRPTKIAVERRPDRQAEIDREYRAYSDGTFLLPGSEVYQLGFRLGRRLGHERVYGVDAWGRYYAPALDLEQFAPNLTTRELRVYLEGELGFDPGAGHLPILRHCVQASPECALVEVAEYLRMDVQAEG